MGTCVARLREEEDDDNDKTSEESDIEAGEEICKEVFKEDPISITTRSGKTGGKIIVSISSLLQQRKLLL